MQTKKQPTTHHLPINIVKRFNYCPIINEKTKEPYGWGMCTEVENYNFRKKRILLEDSYNALFLIGLTIISALWSLLYLCE